MHFTDISFVIQRFGLYFESFQGNQRSHTASMISRGKPTCRQFSQNLDIYSRIYDTRAIYGISLAANDAADDANDGDDDDDDDDDDDED